MGKKSYIFVLLIIICTSIAIAASIHGSVYTLELDKAENVIVMVNSSPRQFIVSKDGDYSFNVPQGNYNLKAYLQDKDSNIIASTEENITASSEGTFILDLILFPLVDFEEDILNDSEIGVEDDLFEEEESTLWFITKIASLIMVSLAVIWGILRLTKDKPKEEKDDEKPAIKEEDIKEEPEKIVEEMDADVEKVLNAIKEAGGRMTQKDLRAKFPSSEAKISLVVSELEHKGIIEKIKKGRGNILILKKK